MRNKLVPSLCFLMSIFSLCACTLFKGIKNGQKLDLPIKLVAEEDKWYFSSTGLKNFYASNNYSNGGDFNCVWKKDNISFKNNTMSMTVSKNNGNYIGAEYRSYQKFGYGYYATSMKAISCSGIISSFFTYTYGPWDEIDIEFLGYNTKIVQFNYYTDGKGGHEYLYRLGFDASLDFHEYGFDWQEDYIVFYVDGKAIHKATKEIPSHVGNIMANVWTGKGNNFISWCRELDEEKLPATAEYQWFSYKGN